VIKSWRDLFVLSRFSTGHSCLLQYSPRGEKIVFDESVSQKGTA